MNARRLGVILLMGLLLVLPLVAQAEPIITDIYLQYERYNELTGQNEIITVDPEQRFEDYEWNYTDGYNSSIWIEIKSPDIPLDHVRVIAVVRDEMGGISEQAFVDPNDLEQTGWLDLTTSQMLPSTLSLIGEDVAPLISVQVTMSREPMPDEDGDPYREEEDPSGVDDPYREEDPSGADDPYRGEDDIPSVITDDMLNTQSGYGTANAEGTPLYSTVHGEVIGYIGPNHLFTYYKDDQFQAVNDLETGLWVPVKLEGSDQIGYVLRDEVLFMDDVQLQSFRSGQDAGDSGTTSDVQQMPEDATDYLQMKVDGTVTADDGTEVTLLTSDVLTYVNHYVDDQSGKLFLQVRTPDGQIATLLYDDLEFLSTQDAAIYEEAQRALQEQEQQRQQEQQSQQQRDSVQQDEAAGSSVQSFSALGANVQETETQPKVEEIQHYATVINGMANVRSDATSNSTPLFAVGEGTVVLAMTLETPANSAKSYYYVEIQDGAYKGRQGYIDSTLLSVMDATGDKAYLAQVAKAQEDAANAQQPPKEEENKQEQLAQVSGYFRVNVTYAPLTSWADLGANVIGVLSQNDVVYVEYQTYDGSDNIWSRAQPQATSNASWGFVQHKYLTAMTSAQVSNYFASKTPTTAPTSPVVSTDSFSGYAILTSTSVNFRTSASSANNNNVMKQLPKGTLVRVISETTAGGYTWYQVESNGTTGYIRSDVLSLLSIREYQLLATSSSSSYDNNGNIITPTATANSSSINTSTWTTPKPGATSGITFVTIPPMSTASPDPSASADSSASSDPDATDDLLAGTSASPSPSATPLGTDDQDFPEQTGSGFSASSLLIALGVIGVLGAGGAYGYSVYNKARKKQAEEAAKELVTDETAEGDRPAVRRPVPPTVVPGTTDDKNNAQAKPGTQTVQPGAKLQPGQPNPYARPQGQRTQDVTSTTLRAQVDGKPVTGKPAGTAQTGQANPYMRPQTQQKPGQPGQAGPTGTTAKPATPAQTGAGTSSPPKISKTAAAGTTSPRAPVAPEPVAPDETATSADGSAPRRRRRRQALDENGGTPTDKKE